MKRLILTILLMFMLSGTAEAGMGSWLKNSWRYVSEPVPCAMNFVNDVVRDTIGFVECVLGNITRNPFTLKEIP